MLSISRQLYLFDCDGGRGNLFSELKRNQIPDNYELYLFWNNNDEVVTKKLQQLSIYHNVNLAPSHLKNVKNSADGKLIYFLGKLANEFDTITIIGGGDCVYEEVIEAVKYDYPQKKITLEKIERPNSSKLEILFYRPLSNVKNNSDEIDNKSIDEALQSKLRTITHTIHIVPNQSIPCPRCPNSARTYSPTRLRKHLLTAKTHSKQITEVSKACSLNVKENNMFCSMARVKLIHPSLGGVFEPSKKGKKCPLCSSSKQKYKAISLYKHLREKHPASADVQIQCCNEQVTYNDLNEFRQHVLSDPFEMTYKMYA